MNLVEASKKKRFLNFIIDTSSIILFMELTLFLQELVGFKAPFEWLRIFIAFGGYYILMEFYLGKTMGKFLTRTSVVKRDGSKIDFRTAVIRFLCRWIPFETFSLALGEDAKAWHDVLSKTYVIKD